MTVTALHRDPVAALVDAIHDNPCGGCDTVRDRYPDAPAEQCAALVEDVEYHMHRFDVLMHDDPHTGLWEFYGLTGSVDAAEEKAADERGEAEQAVARFFLEVA